MERSNLFDRQRQVPVKDVSGSQDRRARALGIGPGVLPPGPLNAITDVDGVRVGHIALVEGSDIRTGATAILPHDGNLLQDRVPAGLSVANGHGKMIGATQIVELGEIETPVVLTNTLAAPRAAEAILDWTLAQPGNGKAVSINPVVGETNDGRLNAIEKRALTVEQILRAIETAAPGPVEEGCVGAGTGTVAMGWKAGIGTSSRVLPERFGRYTVGVLVQSNFPGVLRVLGAPIGRLLGRHDLAAEPGHTDEGGSIMIVVATDAPLSDRNLTRLARRAFAGLARTGASFSNGSGDYTIAFSTAAAVRRTPERRDGKTTTYELANERVSPLFQAVIEATEEAIYNSLFAATTMCGRNARTVEALPIDRVLSLLRHHTTLAVDGRG
jgi:D-aminopeptidase